MSLREMLSDYWYAFQQELFPRLEGELGPMGERYELFVAVLELVRVEALLPYFRGQVGRPEEDRAALARAFIAKAVFDIPTTRGLIERLEVDGRLWRLCGWSGAGRLPSEATFSRAFSEFAESRLANRLHETLIARTMDGHLIEHISRDATAIEAREKAAPKPKAAKPKRRKRGRPRKEEARAKEPSRLERQLTMSLPQMLADLPRACDVGSKRNAKGHTTSWIGYKLHVDTADGGIPISCIMTSASTHDSQVAIPLGTLTAGRVENLYDLMDAAYDSIEIWAHSILLGHKPIIDVNPRRSVEMQEALKQEKKARRTLGLVFPEERRYVVRLGSERINGRLKDEFGGRHVRVRGYDKVLAHLMFGMTVLTASQLMRLIVPPIQPGSSPSPSRWPHFLERRCGQTRPKFDENTESEAVPTLIRPWSRSKSRQLPCADVVASLGVLAPLRIDQNFASGSQVYARLRRLHRRLEEASADLGANLWQTFLRITLPNIRTAILGSALLVFTLSFDEIAIAFFLTGADNTLPMHIWSMLREGISPEIAAIATITVSASIALMLIGLRLLRSKREDA